MMFQPYESEQIMNTRVRELMHEAEEVRRVEGAIGTNEHEGRLDRLVLFLKRLATRSPDLQDC